MVRLKLKKSYVSLTHWGRVTYICVGNLTIIGPDNGLSPGRRQAIIWTNAWILLIGPWGTNFSEILICIQTFSFKKMHLKMSSAKWRPFCLGLNVLNYLWPWNWQPRLNDNMLSDITWAPRRLISSCVFNSLLKHTTQKYQSPSLLLLCVGNSKRPLSINLRLFCSIGDVIKLTAGCDLP